MKGCSLELFPNIRLKLMFQSEDKLFCTFSFGLQQISVYCVLIIVVGHMSHRRILPPCKLILCYCHFTSASLWKWNLAGESTRKEKMILLHEMIFFICKLFHGIKNELEQTLMFADVGSQHPTCKFSHYIIRLDSIYLELFLIHEPLSARLSTDQQSCSK